MHKNTILFIYYSAFRPVVQPPFFLWYNGSRSRREQRCGNFSAGKRGRVHGQGIFSCGCKLGIPILVSPEKAAEGDTLDLRTVPSAVGGDEEKRHGVVLAKSGPAKAFGVRTGESLFSARLKCPDLVVTPPDFDFYVQNSKALIAILAAIHPRCGTVQHR